MTMFEAPAIRLLFRLAYIPAIIFCAASSAHAGGPKYIAGTTYFTSALPGQALTWPQGQISYYTDQGDLSQILPNASANAFVANAFSVWTSVPTAAIVATNPGELSEDVNGSDVYRNSDGTLTIPADIQPSATTKPVAVVYDYDGSVTNAFLGEGAGDPAQCSDNAAFGGVDNFGVSANFLHALVVINGLCAQQSSQLTDVEYRLVRVLGEVIGLGWSQVNLNVVTGNPPPTPQDLLGFPVMHYKDLLSCYPITTCYANPYQLAMDDVASISSLYPVTAQNQSNFTGKTLFATTTASIHGSVWFTGPAGVATVPMQGVNVVARWIDPSTGQPSRQYAASSVSGFMFIGNAGNPITGFDDSLGNPLSNWGSIAPTAEGSFELSGLQIPNAASSAQYILSVENVDPLWSEGVGPYAPLQVALSGEAPILIVTVTPGSNVEQDILMAGSAQPIPSWSTSETWGAPAAIPPAADWMESLSGSGDVNYFSLTAQANRTLSVAVTALDENGNASTDKAQPVIGIWSATDPEGTPPPALTPSAFNSGVFGLTLLNAQIFGTAGFIVGISDIRGDGRPDYHYHAHVLYGDSVTPARIGASGGAVIVSGMGFTPQMTAVVGAANATQLATGSGEMVLSVPALPDGVQNITILDPISTSSSVMTNVLTLGAAASDNIVLVPQAIPPAAVGTQAVKPVLAQVVEADGVTPVAGATVAWTSTDSAALSACGGAFSCSVSTDALGYISTFVTPEQPGVANITATLAPLSYGSSKSVSAQVLGTSSSSAIGVVPSSVSIAQGATVTVPLTARALSNGIPQNPATVNFTIVSGSGNLSASSASVNSQGIATVNLTLPNFVSMVQVNACINQTNGACAPIVAVPVPASQQNLLPVAGSNQIVTSGQIFQPIIVRVTDSSSPPNPVMGAPVTFENIVERPAGDSSAGNSGESGSGNPAMPAILSVAQTNTQTDVNGVASVLPSTASLSGTLEVDVLATAGTGAMLNYILQSLPATTANNLQNSNSPNP